MRKLLRALRNLTIGAVLLVLTSLDARAQIGPRSRARSAIPPNVRVERDIPYAETDHPRQHLDLYLPFKRESQRLPLIVFIHGGGWRNGDKAIGARWLIPYVVTQKFVGASVGYRLSDDATWPAQIHDCKAAIRWLRANAPKFGIDSDRIAVVGTSAGGHLVSLLGTSGDVPPLEGTLGQFDETSSCVTCVVNYFGPTDLLTMNDFPSKIDHDAPDSPESKMLGGTLPEHPQRAREASPQTHISKGDSPFLIIHGTDDQLVPYDQSVQFDKRLRAAGVPSLLIRVEGGEHGSFSNPEIDRRVELFLQRHLLGEEVVIPDGAVRPRVAARRPHEQAPTDDPISRRE